MSKLILPPDVSKKNHHDVVFFNTPPGQEDRELAEIVKKHIEAEQSLGTLAAGSWYRAGLGPHPVNGGEWVTGSTLSPLGSTPSGKIDHIKYNYDRDRFGSWTSQIGVRLYILTPAGAELGFADITASGSGTINAAGNNYPADCLLALRMKVGNLSGGLFNPPYIDGYDCTVFYV
ncbi:hypothetical protein RS584_14675 [Enterobacter sp. DTU_2021_1002640_1_SI_PRY_ASU_LCPMC_013]|uniref:hypothetical protein n=1 Tax=Enterobacter sp. DTU_2021_1002640_1_SI_PRY_ASU_LCPMC_013 TaxID=3077940 RepID=UPI0028EE45B9|nr:hypothetical protein [Enterobacter sp. DTU_2021_1002640_1_SI_PRY_ASU_LCPMC_013]WNU98964.1 hypothetical protein RS584_14675 [Enterobacter sp. DTU_2021_1002640_1_SI_PRY_ASU_LCPMC_013]